MNHFKLVATSGAEVPLPSRLQRVERSQRLKRAAKGGGLGIALALASIPLPGLHFLLVPGFLGFAIYFGQKRYREIYQIDLTDVACPVCQVDLKEKMRYLIEFDQLIRCFGCRNQLRLVPASATSSASNLRSVKSLGEDCDP